jgi:hypothetical protein
MDWILIYAIMVTVVYVLSFGLIIPINNSLGKRSQSTIDDMAFSFWSNVVFGLIALILAWVLYTKSTEIEKAKKYNEENAQAIEDKTKTRDPKADSNTVGLWIFSFIFTAIMVVGIITLWMKF